ncbi:MAG: hypothetical protein AB1798_17385 [Spirochaetota bacterium]
MKEGDLVIGLMAAFGKDEYSVEQLLCLTAPFGVSALSVRTNLSRLLKREVLVSRREGRAAFYSFGNKWKNHCCPVFL